MSLKEDVCNAKIKNIEDKIHDIIKLSTNTTVDVKINDVKNEIPSITNLATTTTTTTLNAKINEVKNKTNMTNLAITAALATVENKIPNICNLVKKLVKQKISETESEITTDHDYDKYITTHEFNNLISEKLTARLK